MDIYDSLSRGMQKFAPKGKIAMYVCGLTPYDHAHIGHTRTYIAFDVVKRYLQIKGHEIYHIQNITDVEDKIIKRCKETGGSPKKLTETLHAEALELFDKLWIKRADIYPKVTENIREIIEMISQLIKNGYAYETPSGIYYPIGKFKSYGKLSGQKLDWIRAGARVEIDETKQAPEDFALWKKTKGEILEFNSPWGSGRPGWHIECSAMAAKYAPDGLTIHGGARDLIFPHHENEIAQSEAALDRKFSQVWMHTGFLTVRGEKMSKSLGNFVTLKDALQKFTPNAIRMFMLSSHYRSQVDYDEDKIEAAEETCERIFNCLGLLREAVANKEKKEREDKEFQTASNEKIKAFYDAMDNDFDTPVALASLFELVREANTHAGKKEVGRKHVKHVITEIEGMLSVLGIIEKNDSGENKKSQVDKIIEKLGGKHGKTIYSSMSILIGIRDDARKNRGYQKSDEIRDELVKAGIVLEDIKGKTKWKVS